MHEQPAAPDTWIKGKADGRETDVPRLHRVTSRTRVPLADRPRRCPCPFRPVDRYSESSTRAMTQPRLPALAIRTTSERGTGSQPLPLT